jgi:predicted Ser/Thr protein kinase
LKIAEVPEMQSTSNVRDALFKGKNQKVLLLHWKKMSCTFQTTQVALNLV